MKEGEDMKTLTATNLLTVRMLELLADFLDPPGDFSDDFNADFNS